jgi:hypothetical protein
MTELDGRSVTADPVRQRQPGCPPTPLSFAAHTAYEVVGGLRPLGMVEGETLLEQPTRDDAATFPQELSVRPQNERAELGRAPAR